MSDFDWAGYVYMSCKIGVDVALWIFIGRSVGYALGLVSR